MIDTSDVAVALGRPAPATGSAEEAQWTLWINNALLLIRFGDGVHTGLGDLALLDQEVLAYVTLEAVVAQVRKPDNATQVDVAVDDGRVSRTYSSANGRVTILPEWWALLNPSSRSSQSFSIRPNYTPDSVCW